MRNGNKEVFGRIEASRSSISKELEKWDSIEEDRCLNLKEKNARDLVLSKLWDLDCMEEVSWRHKSRALWLKLERRGQEHEVFPLHGKC